MKAERPSRTAQFVTLGRALADTGLSHVPDFHDPTARIFLNEKGKRSLAKTEQLSREGKRSTGLEMARVMADMIALRTAAICFWVFASTFPVVVPFFFIGEVEPALRLSNAIAIAMLLVCGYALARCTGLRPWATGLLMVAIGCAMVGVAILLGG